MSSLIIDKHYEYEVQKLGGKWLWPRIGFANHPKLPPVYRLDMHSVYLSLQQLCKGLSAVEEDVHIMTIY